MNVNIKIGDQLLAGDVSTLPIQLWTEKIYSQKVLIFYVNGQEYHFFISKRGKLAVSKPE